MYLVNKDDKKLRKALKASKDKSIYRDFQKDFERIFTKCQNVEIKLKINNGNSIIYN